GDVADEAGDVDPVRIRAQRRCGSLEAQSVHGRLVRWRVIPSARAQAWISKPSADSTISSIATSVPPFAASVGPVYFIGMQPRSTQVRTGLRASSIIVIATVFCAAGPSVRDCWIQAHRLSKLTMPRLQVTSLTLWMPATLRTWFSLSLPARYSAKIGRASCRERVVMQRDEVQF